MRVRTRVFLSRFQNLAEDYATLSDQVTLADFTDEESPHPCHPAICGSQEGLPGVRDIHVYPFHLAAPGLLWAWLRR